MHLTEQLASNLEIIGQAYNFSNESQLTNSTGSHSIRSRKDFGEQFHGIAITSKQHKTVANKQPATLPNL
jgi:hypothetical protein